MSPRRLIVMAWFAAALLSPASSALAKTYDIHSQRTGVTSAAELTDNQLDVVLNNVLYRFQRDPRFDSPDALGFYNASMKQAVRWPRVNKGSLTIGEESEAGVRYRPSPLQVIGPRATPPAAPQPPAPQPPALPRAVPAAPQRAPAPQQPPQLVVIESALPGRGLVSTVLEPRAAIEIGDANARALRQQFYLQPQPNGYVSLIPASQTAAQLDIRAAVVAPGVGVELSASGGRAAPDSAQFRLMPAGNGSYFIESKLPGNLVWDVNGVVAALGTKIRLMPRNNAAAQQFRIAPAQAAPPPVYDPDLDVPSFNEALLVPVIPFQPVPQARVRLANTQQAELWVQLVDRRAPDDPQQLRIPAGKSVDVLLTPDVSPLPAVLYDVSVYELALQSMVIDATARGRGAVTEQSFSPKSIGWFEIPPPQIRPGATIDVYRYARRNNNPGAVARIDVEEWSALPLVGEPSPAAQPPSAP